METRYRNVTPEEMAGTYFVPTLSVNQFVANVVGNNLRIAFGERMPDGGSIYRTAVSMTTFEAFELRNVLNALLAPNEQEFNDYLNKQLSDAPPVATPQTEAL